MSEEGTLTELDADLAHVWGHVVERNELRRVRPLQGELEVRQKLLGFGGRIRNARRSDGRFRGHRRTADLGTDDTHVRRTAWLREGRTGLEERAQSETEDEPGSRGGSNPSRRHARARGCGALIRLMTRESDDARGMNDMLDTPGNLLLLRAKPLRWKDFVELGVHLGSEPIHEASEIDVPRVACRAVGQMLGSRRIDRLSAVFGSSIQRGGRPGWRGTYGLPTGCALASGGTVDAHGRFLRP